MNYIRPNDPPGTVHTVNDAAGEVILATNKGFVKVQPLEVPPLEVPKTEVPKTDNDSADFMKNKAETEGGNRRRN